LTTDEQGSGPLARYYKELWWAFFPRSLARFVNSLMIDTIEVVSKSKLQTTTQFSNKKCNSSVIDGDDQNVERAVCKHSKMTRKNQTNKKKSWLLTAACCRPRRASPFERTTDIVDSRPFDWFCAIYTGVVMLVWRMACTRLSRERDLCVGAAPTESTATSSNTTPTRKSILNIFASNRYRLIWKTKDRRTTMLLASKTLRSVEQNRPVLHRSRATLNQTQATAIANTKRQYE
jgi:hypothetical protein